MKSHALHRLCMAALTAAVLACLPPWPAAAQEPPHEDGLKEALSEPAVPPQDVKPMSDAEETGSPTDMLPGYIDPLTLPSDVSAARGSLFPPELWAIPPESYPEEPYVLPLAAAVEEGGALDGRAFAAGFGAAELPALCDPQSLLPAEDAAVLGALAGRSMQRHGFRFCLVLLGGAQQVPAGVDYDALMQRWPGTAKGVTVIYYAGRPERTLAWFSPAARSSHRTEDLRMIIDLGMKEAARAGAPLPQLQRFIYKTLLRLDRLHRQGEVSPSDEIPAASTAAATAAAPAAGIGWWSAVIAGQGVALAAAVLWWRRRKRLAGEIIVLPGQEIMARLGGPHSGGSGAVLTLSAPR
jgi:hypothetical protein